MRIEEPWKLIPLFEDEWKANNHKIEKANDLVVELIRPYKSSLSAPLRQWFFKM